MLQFTYHLCVVSDIQYPCEKLNQMFVCLVNSFHFSIRMEAAFIFLAALLTFMAAKAVEGHAIFWEPPSRASLGKHNLNFCRVPVNNDHMSVYCGGINVRVCEKEEKKNEKGLNKFCSKGPTFRVRRKMRRMRGSLWSHKSTSSISGNLCHRNYWQKLLHTWPG
jgi:hypothetical protein